MTTRKNGSHSVVLCRSLEYPKADHLINRWVVGRAKCLRVARRPLSPAQVGASTQTGDSVVVVMQIYSVSCRTGCFKISFRAQMWGPWILELIREFRFYQPAPAAIGPVVVCLLCLGSCCIGFCCGALVVALILSSHCRRAAGFLLRLSATGLESPSRARSAATSALARLREYRE